MYRYAYDFMRSANDNTAQRTVDVDTAVAMLHCVLAARWGDLNAFCRFLAVRRRGRAGAGRSGGASVQRHERPVPQETGVRVLNKDQWASILEFAMSIAADLSNYDELSACARACVRACAGSGAMAAYLPPFSLRVFCRARASR